jgi:hypothetical protein
VSDSLRAAQPRLAHSSEPSRSPPPVARRPPPVAAPRPTPSAAAAAAASPEPERRSGGFFGYSHITSGYDGGQAEFVRCARARSAPSAAAATARRRLASLPSLSLRPLAPTPSPTSPSPSPQRPLCRREPPEGPALAAGREGAVPVRQPAHRLVRLRVRRRGPRLQRRYLGRRCESARPLAPPEWGARRRVRSAACAPPRARHRVRAAACAPPRARRRVRAARHPDPLPPCARPQLPARSGGHPDGAVRRGARCRARRRHRRHRLPPAARAREGSRHGDDRLPLSERAADAEEDVPRRRVGGCAPALCSVPRRVLPPARCEPARGAAARCRSLPLAAARCRSSGSERAAAARCAALPLHPSSLTAAAAARRALDEHC